MRIHPVSSQVHSATVDSGALSEEVTRGLWELRHKRGWRIGLSLSGTGQAETLRWVATCWRIDRGATQHKHCIA